VIDAVDPCGTQERFKRFSARHAGHRFAGRTVDSYSSTSLAAASRDTGREWEAATDRIMAQVMHNFCEFAGDSENSPAAQGTPWRR